MRNSANPTTMEGMIYNANDVLEMALKPSINGMPKRLFEGMVGIVLTSSVQAGFLFSGTVGSGIAFSKTADGWSPPCAVGLSGIGFGLLLGGSVQDLIVFVYDEETMKSIAKKHGVALEAQLELTLGPFGRAAKISDTLSKGGLGATFCVAYSSGVFGGFSAAGAKLGSRDKVNNKFYGVTTKPDDILFTPGSVTVPEDKVTLLNEVYDKLSKLQEGATQEPDAAEEDKKKSAKEVADKEHESVKNDPEAEVVEVDAAAEAAKESAASAAPAASATSS